MKSVPHNRPLPSPLPLPVTPAAFGRTLPDPRLRLKPKAAPTGYVDGGWWPWSRDLVVELPALVRVLDVRLGRVIRVAYSIDVWKVLSRQTTVDGHTVRLDGFHSQDPNIVQVTGLNRGRIVLLVVPPEADADAGHDAMMTAAARGNGDRPVEILAAHGAMPVARLHIVRAEPVDEPPL